MGGQFHSGPSVRANLRRARSISGARYSNEKNRKRFIFSRSQELHPLMSEASEGGSILVPGKIGRFHFGPSGSAALRICAKLVFDSKSSLVTAMQSSTLGKIVRLIPLACSGFLSSYNGNLPMHRHRKK
jgi:hypothetical protein